jgi:hypothetical protein
MTQIIEKTRDATEDEFFFRHHDNIGMSAEFERLIKYISANSNIHICRINYESLDQMRSGSAGGSSLNFKVFKNE